MQQGRGYEGKETDDIELCPLQSGGNTIWSRHSAGPSINSGPENVSGKEEMPWDRQDINRPQGA